MEVLRVTIEPTSAPFISSLEELVQEVTVSLVGITYYKVSAELADDVDADDPSTGEMVPTYGLKLLSEGNEIGVRLSLVLAGDIGQITVDLAANYETPFAVSLADPVRLDFANEVGIMALIPYVRETVWSLSQRVFGKAIVMPVIQRGGLSFSIDEADPT